MCLSLLPLFLSRTRQFKKSTLALLFVVVFTFCFEWQAHSTWISGQALPESLSFEPHIQNRLQEAGDVAISSLLGNWLRHRAGDENLEKTLKR